MGGRGLRLERAARQQRPGHAGQHEARQRHQPRACVGQVGQGGIDGPGVLLVPGTATERANVFVNFGFGWTGGLAAFRLDGKQRAHLCRRV